MQTALSDEVSGSDGSDAIVNVTEDLLQKHVAKVCKIYEKATDGKVFVLKTVLTDKIHCADFGQFDQEGFTVPYWKNGFE